MRFFLGPKNRVKGEMPVLSYDISYINTFEIMLVDTGVSFNFLLDLAKLFILDTFGPKPIINDQVGSGPGN